MGLPEEKRLDIYNLEKLKEAYEAWNPGTNKEPFIDYEDSKFSSAMANAV